MRGGRKKLRFSASTEIRSLDMALGVIRRLVLMKHRCELRFCSNRAFTHASLSRVPFALCGLFLYYHGNFFSFS